MRARSNPMRNPSSPASAESQPGRTWRVYATGLSAGAGMIHWIVTPEHFAHWWGYGVFFLAAGAAQVAYAVWLALNQPSRRGLMIGLLGNGMIIALYLVTRSMGIPLFGPSAGEVEPVGSVDVISKAAELALMACLVLMLRARRDAAHEYSLPSVAQGTILRKEEDA